MAYMTDAEFERRRNERDARQTQRMQEMNNVRANDSTGAAIGLGLRQLPGFLKDYAMHYIDASNNSGFARGYSGFKRGLTGNAYLSPEAAQAAEQQTTQPTGGQAIAAEQKQQNTGEPVALTETAKRAVQQPAATGGSTSTMENWSGTNVDVQRDPATGRATSVNFGEAGSGPNTGWGKVVGPAANQQAAAGPSRPGLGLNGMRDLGNGQVAVGQVGGFQNPGYGFKGSREDAERFFQPVGRPGGYNPYKQNFRTLFDEQMDARQRQRERPAMAKMPEAPEGGWQTKLGAYKAQLDFLKNQNQAQLGYDTAAANRALQREQMAQQYGFNMAQAGNDAMRTQAALGLSGLQQAQTMQQMRQQQMLDNARQTYATARPGSQEWIQARNYITATGGGQGEQGKRSNDPYTIKNAEGGEERMQDVYDESGNLLYARKVPSEQEAQIDTGIKQVEAFLSKDKDNASTQLPAFRKAMNDAKTPEEKLEVLARFSQYL